ncbi:MAG: TIGR03915 family putative DNA repair protein [Prevotellaceae bacterium]|jgi:probable DNA metabolism protein|nr:TIGR03915 family putative DNA repair protein [Prevotellaceae bacterium]
MLYFIYDNTFEGLLTCVFEAFNRREFPQRIVRTDSAPLLFTESFKVITDEVKAERVLNALGKKISPSALRMLFVVFLSEQDGIEIVIFRYIQKALTASKSIEMNFADADVLALSKIYKKVMREEEHVRQFVRFQKTADNIYFAVIEPVYNVLPLTAGFFKTRYADQQWIVYDTKRKYGLFYDLNTVETVSFDNLDISPVSGDVNPQKLDESELHFQTLWKDYLKAITIRERLNPKLQRQFMPVRFWKHLTELKIENYT